MDIFFNSLEELFKRLKPALTTKQREMLRNHYTYIKVEDIWNYLKETKWKVSASLELSDMVNDILSCSDIDIDNYVKNKIKNEERVVYFSNKDNLL